MLDALAFCREVILKQFFRHVKMQPAFCRELHFEAWAAMSECLRPGNSFYRGVILERDCMYFFDYVNVGPAAILLGSSCALWRNSWHFLGTLLWHGGTTWVSSSVCHLRVWDASPRSLLGLQVQILIGSWWVWMGVCRGSNAECIL